MWRSTCGHRSPREADLIMSACGDLPCELYPDSSMEDASFALGPMTPALPNAPGIANFEAEMEWLPSEGYCLCTAGFAQGR